MRNPAFLDCSEAAKLCTKKEYKECSFPDKLKLKLHLLLCKTCAEYNKKNSKLSRLFNKADFRFCTPEEKIAFKKKMKESSGTTEN